MRLMTMGATLVVAMTIAAGVGRAQTGAAPTAKPAGRAAPAAAPQPQAAGGTQPQRAFEPKNLQVLVGLDREQFRAEMQLISASLGYTCERCHVEENPASDEKREKQTARRMLQMTKAINAQFFEKARPTEGTTMGRVTCHTCHRGAEHPVHKPAPPTPGAK